jgi:hypothetical protein
MEGMNNMKGTNDSDMKGMKHDESPPDEKDAHHHH